MILSSASDLGSGSDLRSGGCLAGEHLINDQEVVGSNHTQQKYLRIMN